MTDLVSEARLVSSLARKRAVDAEDARLAAWMLQERTTACPPPRHVTSEVGHVSRVTCTCVMAMCLQLAMAKNSAPLSTPAQKSGLRLPPDRYCLTAANFRSANSICESV